MKLKPINESVLDLVDDKVEDMVVADAGLVLADEIANKEAEKNAIKKEVAPVMDQTKAIAKTTNADAPAEILEALDEPAKSDNQEEYKQMVKTMKSLKELAKISNDDFIRAAKEAIRA